MQAAVGLTFLEYAGVSMSSSAVLPVKVLLSFLCFAFGVCNGLVIANAMICSMRAAGRNSGAGTGLLGAMQMLFGGIAGGAIIALGGADYFSVTATGLLIMSLCAVLSSFLAPNSR